MEKGQIYLHVLRLGLSHKKSLKPNKNEALNLFRDLVRITLARVPRWELHNTLKPITTS
jgi:hypothetical protein